MERILGKRGAGAGKSVEVCAECDCDDADATEAEALSGDLPPRPRLNADARERIIFVEAVESNFSSVL